MFDEDFSPDKSLEALSKVASVVAVTAMMTYAFIQTLFL